VSIGKPVIRDWDQFLDGTVNIIPARGGRSAVSNPGIAHDLHSRYGGHITYQPLKHVCVCDVCFVFGFHGVIYRITQFGPEPRTPENTDLCVIKPQNSEFIIKFSHGNLFDKTTAILERCYYNHFKGLILLYQYFRGINCVYCLKHTL
jgi:hypothetical protein